jgi:hypothetical protein
MNIPSMQQLQLGSGILTATGNSLYLNGTIVSSSTPTGSFATTGQILGITATGLSRVGILSANPQYTLDVNGNIGNSNGNIPNSYIDTSNTYLRDGSNVISLIWNDRTLRDTSQVTALDWSARGLSGTWLAQNLTISGSPVVISSQTGQFYPSVGNPSGFITAGLGGLTSGYIPFGNGTSALSSTSGLIWNGGLGVVGSGNFSNGIYDSGVRLANVNGRSSVNYNTIIDWSTSNQFYTTLTGNSTFSFTNSLDGQSINVLVRNTGINYFTGTWPSNVKWSYQYIPVQTSGNFTDIYTFVNFTGVIYGSATQGF